MYFHATSSSGIGFQTKQTAFAMSLPSTLCCQRFFPRRFGNVWSLSNSTRLMLFPTRRGEVAFAPGKVSPRDIRVHEAKASRPFETLHLESWPSTRLQQVHVWILALECSSQRLCFFPRWHSSMPPEVHWTSRATSVLVSCNQQDNRWVSEILFQWTRLPLHQSTSVPG